MLLREILPAHSAELLEVLTIIEEEVDYADPETVKQLCLNGKLRCLYIECYVEAGAFSMDTTWQDIPKTLQSVGLCLSLYEGISLILEQLPNLEELSLMHDWEGRMHLERPFGPIP